MALSKSSSSLLASPANRRLMFFTDTRMFIHHSPRPNVPCIRYPYYGGTGRASMYNLIHISFNDFHLLYDRTRRYLEFGEKKNVAYNRNNSCIVGASIQKSHIQKQPDPKQLPVGHANIYSVLGSPWLNSNFTKAHVSTTVRVLTETLTASLRVMGLIWLFV